MNAAVNRFWNARTATERSMVMAGLAIVAIAIYALLVHSAGQARARLMSSITTLETQAAQLERQAAEYERLRTLPAAPLSQTDARAIVEAQASSSGLSATLSRLQARDADHVQVTFGAVAFSDWLNWVSALQAQKIRVESCRIEALSTPGLVSVTAVLARARPS
jgi:general secretion pathway protein M